MPILSHRRNSRRFPRSISLATNIMVLLILVGIADGSVSFPLSFQPYSTITSPPVLLQAGTAGSSTIYANNTSARVSTVAPRNWLSPWEKRVKITISKNNISGVLSDFPVLVHLSNSSSGRSNDDVSFVFDELQNDANRKKIAVTTNDGTTQCYVEIEKWSDASEQAWLWVKVPSISSGVDTNLYLYYDRSRSDNTAYVGDKGSAVAQNVWNTEFKGVWHFDEDPSGTAPQMKDSTSNYNNGTSNGAMTSGDQVTGKIDGSLDFDGNDDYIQTTSNELKTLGNFTLSIWFKTDSTTASRHILWEGPASGNGWGDGSGNPSSHEMHLTICKFDANNTITFFYGYEESGGVWAPAVEIITSFSDTTNWNHVVVVMTGAGTSPSAELFLNAVSKGTDVGTQTNRTGWDTDLRIGRPGANQRYFDGMIDEVRVIETAKSAGWIEASCENERDHLLDFGSEELCSYYPTDYNILGGNWRDLSWGYRKRIIINHVQVQANLTGFPVLINLASDGDLASHAQSNGNDILFTSSNGVTKLSHEIEKYNSTTGALVAWVKIPSLSSSVDTDLYMYYGNPTCGSQQDAINVWESNFIGVWHLKENPSGTAPQMKDSTKANNGTSGGTMTSSDQLACKINGGLDFDGSDDNINCGDINTVDGATSLTVSAWIKCLSLTADGMVLGKDTFAANSELLIWRDETTSVGARTDTFSAQVGTGSADAHYYGSTGLLNDNNWHFVVITYVGGSSTGLRAYVDGVEDTAQSPVSTTSVSALRSTTNPVYIGRSQGGSPYFTGDIDEVRISGIARTAAWISTEYNNQNSQSTFYSLDGQEGNPKVSGTVPTSLYTVDSDYFVVQSTGSATSTTAYNPSGYSLVGSTTLVSGTTSDLVSNNSVYMTFRSYASTTSGQPLYAHQETTTIGGTSYYLLNVSSANAAGTTLSASAGSTGRKLMGKFVYKLTGVSSIPASTWTMYYRAYRSSFSVAAHGDVDILIRMSNGTVRTTRATNVANSTAIGTSWGTVSGTHSWSAYTVVDQTDYLEIDYYIEVTTSAFGASVYLRIDDNTVALSSQTRASNVYLPSEFTAETEFTGSSNTQPWYQFVRAVDSAWTAGSVTVTIQIYNYTSGAYPTSGNGYDSYTSAATPNTDETRTHTIITNPTSFRNATGYWRIKVKGVKTTTTQFDFKADWLKFEPSHYSEYTASTEFLFSSMTKNTPTQLNFTVVSEYDAISVSVTIQVWNYSSSAYVTSGQGYLTYASSGSNETKVISINTNPQFYASSGNAKIKITGAKTTATQYQQKTNQVKLLYTYSSSSSYNYVLKIVNQVSDAWKIRLRAYAQSGINRLANCTMYFRNASDGTSRQIYIQNGAYVNQTGSWYDLQSSPAEKYIAIALQANDSTVSVIYVYLEILIPNKTTYSQYVITFEIT